MRNASLVPLLSLGAASLVVLVGCSAPDAAQTPPPTPPASAPSTPSEAPSPSPSPSSDASACGPSDGQEAASAAIAELSVPPTMAEDTAWDAQNAEYDGYDACAPLSWVTVTVDMATASSPYAILLFHEGSYQGTATAEKYPFHPDVTRADPATIDVDYHYPQDGESNADRSGIAHASFTWDEDAGEVVMSGDVPPTP